MTRDFTRVRPPKETREELVKGIKNSGGDRDLTEFLLTFFTNVDLRLILDQLEEELKNRPT